MHGGGGPVVGSGLAAALARGCEAGTPEGVAETYDTYADALFAYCRTLVGDERIAAEALHDTLLVVRSRARGLDDASLRALLYAVARSECLRHSVAARGAGKIAPDTADVWRPGAVPTVPVRDRIRLLPLIPVALAGVDAAEREALELAVRHGLDDAALGRVLDLPERQAARVAARGREQFADCLTVHAVCVHADQECAELAVLLPDGVVSGAALPAPIESGLRVPARLHVDSCPLCGPFRPSGLTGDPDAAVRPGGLVDALLATGPARPAPLAVRADLLRSLTTGAPGAHGHSLIVERAVRAGRDGFPRTRRRLRPPLATAAAAAAAGVVLTFALAAFQGGHDTAPQAGNLPVALTSPSGAPAGPDPGPGVAGAAGPGAAVLEPVLPLPSAAPTTASSAPRTSPTPTAIDKPGKGNGNGYGMGNGNGPKGQAGARGDAPGRGDANGLQVLTPTLTLSAARPAGTLRLSAADAPVTWSLGVSQVPWVSFSRTSGTLQAGSSVSITVTWDPARAPAGSVVSATVQVAPGGATITIVGPGRSSAPR